MTKTKNKIANPLDKKSVSITLFVPLCPKAIETQRKDPIIVDTKAVEILSQMDFDTKPFMKKRSYHPAIVRTFVIDRGVKEFLEKNPGGVIINLGCGFDTRICRVDNGTLRWYDIDLPDVIKLRKKFFSESDRVKFIAKSVLDFSWMNAVKVKSTDKILIIAEGLFAFFSDAEVRRIFAQLIDRFPQAEMYLTVLHTVLIGKHVTSHVAFKWGLNKAEDISKINAKIKLLEYWRTADLFKHRQNFAMRFLSAISDKGRNLNRILHVSFENAGNRVA